MNDDWRKDIAGGARERVMRTLGGTPISFCSQNRDLEYLWFENPPAAWNAGSALGGTDRDLFPEAAAAGLRDAKKEVVETGDPARYELALPGEDGVRYYDFYLQPDRDEEGRIQGLLSAIIDVTDRRRSEAIRHTLLREVTHRSKNLLAIVASLAAQTSRSAQSINDFLDRFNGRLQSISRSQDLVTAANWRGARLSELIATQVDPYAEAGRQQIDLAGPDVYLKPNAALHLGLAMHELAVNSVRNGALAESSGRVSVTVGPASGQSAEDDGLSVAWGESSAAGVSGPDPAEFGYVLLTRLVPSALDGAARLSVTDASLSYALTLSRREYE